MNRARHPKAAPPSKVWTGPSGAVPECENFHSFRYRNEPVVEVIANSTEVNATNARQGRVSRQRSDAGLRADEFERSGYLVSKKVGHVCPVCAPPFDRVGYFDSGTTHNSDRESFCSLGVG